MPCLTRKVEAAGVQLENLALEKTLQEESKQWLSYNSINQEGIYEKFSIDETSNVTCWHWSQECTTIGVTNSCLLRSKI